ncbi:MAG: UDP-N-acetylmuramoyl-L-alanyl-D-glutamate--2,6-diaminopimelate ligase [Clostridium lundense]|nr:UDP-N-acetylmuramoyl-L-alanyl-D-glutamate--2,6-diaminopimelate ligase [Clostridium lundense]
MLLRKLLKGLDYELLNGDDNLEVNNINYDSRKVTNGDMFVAIKGYSTDGHKFIHKAYESGAKVILCEDILDDMPKCTIIKVSDSRKALAIAASNFYGNPKDKLKIIGVTGTNGKTTSTFMIKSILETAGYKVGLLGTIANYIGDKKLHADRTTPESLEMHSLFNDMVNDGVDYCVMEVSSHSLYLDRAYGIEFQEGLFTNLTQDHLDFHETFENYYNAKFLLFKNSKNSIINIDDIYGKRVYKEVLSNKITYSLDKSANVSASDIVMHSRGAEFDMNYNNNKIHVEINIPGKYNIMNALGSASVCICEGIDIEVINKGLANMSGVPGRCELVTKDYDLGYDVIVDYAHTPDGLENILKTAKEFTSGRLISVFGCGGDRDKTKRPIMGKLGTELSDIAVITSDNPRSEEPIAIINDVVSGIEKDNYIVVENRRDAIKEAMKIAKEGDVVVVAGKGHEDYQILKDKTIHFDEREIVKEIIQELY